MKEKLVKQDYQRTTPISMKMACEVIVHSADTHQDLSRIVVQKIANEFVQEVVQGNDIQLIKLDESPISEETISVVYEVQVKNETFKCNPSAAATSSSAEATHRAKVVKVQLATLNSIETAVVLDSSHPSLFVPKKLAFLPKRLQCFLVLFSLTFITGLACFLYFIWTRS